MPSRLEVEGVSIGIAAVRLLARLLVIPRALVISLALGLGLAAASAQGAGNIIEYTRDAAGNITGISRQGAATLAITSFTPGSGPAGTTVTIYGSAFSTTPASNVVAFNATSATVSSSTATSITTTVPAGATTGRITVTVAGNTATSGSDFVVTSPGAPTITTFTPTSGPSAATVNVTGTNFDVAANATTVKLNGVTAAATVGTATALSFTVPAAAASGKITAATAAGAGASASDFIVPPPGINAADIATTTRVTADGSAAGVAIGNANKHAIVLFDAVANGFYSIHLGALSTSPTTATVNYKVIAPDNSVLQFGTVGNAAKPSIHLPPLTVTGTYSLVLSPGLATLNTSVRVLSNVVLAIDGSAGTTAFDSPNQSWRFVFDATTGQRVGIGAAGIAFVPSNATPPLYIKIFNPDGTLLSSATQCNGSQVGNTQGNCDGEFAAVASGTHTVVVENPANGYGNLSLRLNSEVTASLAPDVSQAVNLSGVGQDGRFTFTATAGDSLGIDLSDVNLTPAPQTIFAVITRPGGTQATCSFASPGAGYCDFGTIASSGTHTLTLDPAFGAYGTMKLTLKQGALISGNDAPSAFAPTGVSETARYRFTASAGQNLSVGVTGLTYIGSGGNTNLKVYRPDGTSLASATCNPVNVSGTCRLTLSNLPAGIYGLAVQPPVGVKISGNVNVSSDLTGTLTTNVAQSLNASRAGQVARYSFSGTVGDSTSIKIYGISSVPVGQSVQVILYSPAGVAIASSGTLPARGILNLGSLATTGTYTVVVEPLWGITWQGTLVLDPGALITIDGSPPTLTSALGEIVRYRLAGTAGQRLEFGLGGLAYDASNANSTSFGLFRPDGSTVMTASCVTSGPCESFVASLPVSGTYNATFTPPQANAVTAGSVYFSTPVAGTLTVDGGSQTVPIIRNGQTARYTFSGSAAQLLRLNWTGVTVSGSASVSVSVLKPDGTTLSSSTFVNGATGGFDIASLPMTGTYTVVFDPSAGATMSAPVTLVTR